MKVIMNIIDGKSYWLVINHFVHIDWGWNGMLIYNTINKNSHVLCNDAPIAQFLMSIKENRLPMQITSSELLENKTLLDQIYQLRSEYMIDLLPTNGYSSAPIQHTLDANIQSDVSSISLDDINATGTKILRYLTEITIYLTGNSLINSNDYSDANAQFIWPIGSLASMPLNQNIKELISFLHKLNYSSVLIINLVGGNPFLFSCLSELCDLIENKRKPSCRIVYHIYIDEWLLYSSNLKSHQLSGLSLCICITHSRIKNIDLNEFKSSLRFDMNIEFRFLVEDKDDLPAYEIIIKSLGTENISYELYSRDNGSNAFQYQFHEDEILDGEPTMLDIMARKKLNQIQFGKIYIGITGEVYGNCDKASILGNIRENSIESIVYKELTEGTAWMSTRNNYAHCTNCMYRSVCPPLSTYEMKCNKKICTV
ncbi:MAG: hypothetical protein PHQ35_11225 [Phycisphaerae bacterium]|nr:hypothetical protein [Phycisphaerae bacterium]